MSRVCTMTGKKANNAYAVSHSHRRTKKLHKKLTYNGKEFGGRKATVG